MQGAEWGQVWGGPGGWPGLKLLCGWRADKALRHHNLGDVITSCSSTPLTINRAAAAGHLHRVPP